jgi:DNA repair exonuclease SbcCD nuclease subunit
MKIVHIADVHWRGLQRHEEYRSSFEDMFSQCREINPDAIVIAGDIVHSKTQGISPELIDSLAWWFTEMHKICPVHVMLGNHDGLILNSDRQDAISPIVNMLNLPRLYLYKGTGVYQDPHMKDIEWCVYCPFDTKGYDSLKPSGEKPISIALYHGSVWGSHTDGDFMLEGETKMSRFREFTFTMLGDIHKRQQMDAEGRIHYPGSTIQQNYGETPGKGFLCWHINGPDDFRVDFHPVAHNNPFVTVDWQGNIIKTIDACIQAWPSGARYRIRAQEQLDPKTQRKLATALRREYNAFEVVFKLVSINSYDSEDREIEKLEVLNLSDNETHKKLLREYGADEGHDAVFWLECDEIMDKTIKDLDYTIPAAKKWSLRKMNFDNTFGYGSHNTIDFGKLSGVVGLFGPNRCGKSSIPGTLMYSLYNSNDRGLTSNAHVVNYRKKEANSDITFSVNSKLYRLERQSVRYTSRRKGTDGAQTYLNLFEIDEEGCILRDLSGEQRRETEKELKELIGSPDEFMMTSFAAQGNMNAFINKGSTDRKKLLSTFMGLDVFEIINKKIRSEGEGIRMMLKRMDEKDWIAEIRSKRQKIGQLTETNVDLKMEIENLKDRLSVLKSQATEDHDEFVDPETLQRAESNLETKEKQLKRLQSSIQSTKEELLKIESKFSKYDNIKATFPIEGFRRRLENLESLNRSLMKQKNLLDKENRILKGQKHSVSLLKEVPCGDSFPTCKFIAESHRNKQLMAEQKDLVSELRTEVTKMKESIDDLEGEGLRNRIAKYESMLRQEADDKITYARLSSSIETTELKIGRLERDIGHLEEQIVGLKLKLNEDKSDELKRLQRIISSVASQVSEKEVSYLSNVQKVGKYTADIEQLKKDQLEYDRLQIEYKVYDFLQRATSWRGIPTQVMSKQLPAINLELAKILSDVTGFTIELEVDERNTDIFINYGDTRRPLECASGMEKMVSSMALRVAMSNVSSLSKSDMFIVDEGFGALDPQNIEAVTGLLHRLKSYYRLILIISHVEFIKDSVDEVIEITRNGVDSKVVYE